MNKAVAASLVLFGLSVQAQVYRCETAEGVIFSDRECGPFAEVVELDETNDSARTATADVSLETPVIDKDLADRRFVERTRKRFDYHIALLDAQIKELVDQKYKAHNQLNGALLEAEIDDQLTELRKYRSDTISTYRIRLEQLERGNN